MAAVSTHIQTGFFLALLLGILVLSFFIFRPYIGPLVLSATFAVVFYPLYERILKLARGYRNVAASLTVACVVLIVVLPLTFFGTQVFREALDVYVQVRDPSTSFSHMVRTLAEERLARFVPQLSTDLDYYVERALGWLLSNAGQFVSSVATFVLYVFISLLALFYFLRDGQAITGKLKVLSPLPDKYDARVIQRLHDAINSVIRGALLIALIQGIVSGVGLSIFGVPNAVLWGSLAVIAALIPYVGTAVVITPAIAYLLLVDRTGAAIGLAIWGVTAVGLMDNFLGPRLVNRGIKLHPVVILLAVLGGLVFFGPLGYILGPLIISLLFALLDIYPLLVRPKPREGTV